MIKNPIVMAGAILMGFAVLGSGLVAFTYQQTADRIESNEREALLEQLNALVPHDAIDNDIVSDTTVVDDYERLGGHEVKVYLGRKEGEPVAAVFNTVVPDGYSGPIRLLVAVRTDGTLGGVRIVSHKETPGLGDKVEERKSDWVHDFTGKSLGNPDVSRWKVKRDGGVFDQFTGATITPRSIVQAVKNTLLFYREKGQRLFGSAETETGTAALPLAPAPEGRG